MNYKSDKAYEDCLEEHVDEYYAARKEAWIQYVCQQAEWYYAQQEDHGLMPSIEEFSEIIEGGFEFKDEDVWLREKCINEMYGRAEEYRDFVRDEASK